VRNRDRIGKKANVTDGQCKYLALFLPSLWLSQLGAVEAFRIGVRVAKFQGKPIFTHHRVSYKAERHHKTNGGPRQVTKDQLAKHYLHLYLCYIYLFNYLLDISCKQNTVNKEMRWTERFTRL